MTQTNVNVQMQIRRDTFANWGSNNPVLLEGELGYVKDKNIFRIGDGSTVFNFLPDAILTSNNSYSFPSFISNYHLKITGQKELRLSDDLDGATGEHYSSFKAGSQSANINYTLPTTAPTDNQYLKCSAAGVLTWDTFTGADFSPDFGGQNIITTGDIKINGDSGKIKLGTDADLLIYHDGGTSFIEDAGVGNLELKSNGAEIVIKGASNNNARFFNGGGSELHWAGTSPGKKLETTQNGIAVTGKLVGGSVHVNAADNLATDALQFSFSAPEGHLKVKNSSGAPAANLALHTTDASGNTNRVMHLSHDGNVGIGCTPSHTLHVNAGTGNIAALFESTDTDVQIRLKDSNSIISVLEASNGDFRFQNTTNGDLVKIDNTGRLGIGTTSPDRLIHGAGASPILKLDSTNNEAYVQLVTASPSNTLYIGLVDSDIILQSSGANSTGNEKLRIKPNGRVGIGQSNPSGTLYVQDNNGDNVTLILHTGATTNYIQLSDSVNAHNYIGKENSGSNSKTSFYTSNAAANATEKIAHFDYRGLVLSANKGINFSPYDDPYSATNNSNNLDDYEEGNFIPAITGTTSNPTQTYVDRKGYYIKIGRLVHISVDVEFAASGISGGTGEAVLSNLPFAKQNSTRHYGITMAVGYSPNWGSTSCPTGGYINPNATYVFLNPYNSNGAQFSQASQVGNGTRLIAGFTYMSNA